MSNPSHAQKQAIDLNGYHAIEEQMPDLVEALKLLKPLLNNSQLGGLCRKVTSMVNTLKAETKAIGLENYHKEANEELLPALSEAIMKLRPVLSHFRDHNFVGVPKVRKLQAHQFLRIKQIKDELSKAYSKETLQNMMITTAYGRKRLRILTPRIQLIGRWLEKAGFQGGDYMQVLALNGLLIICPDSFSEDRESKAVIESDMLFSKAAV